MYKKWLTVLRDICSSFVQIQLPAAWRMAAQSELVCVLQELTASSDERTGTRNCFLALTGRGNMRVLKACVCYLGSWSGFVC